MIPIIETIAEKRRGEQGKVVKGNKSPETRDPGRKLLP